MKLNIDANVIKSPLNKDFLIADRIQLETDNLSIMLNAMDINIPINNHTDSQNTFKYEGAQKQGNWASYWVNVKAKDLIELYPHVHAHQPGMVSNQTPYDFQFTIGNGLEAPSLYERNSSEAEKRYVEILGIEAGSEELAVRQILSIVAGQLLTSHRYNAHLVNMVGVHIAEQLIHAGMTHFKSGDIKLNGFLLCHGGPVQTERLWRLGNPGTGELTLKHTLLSQQPGTHTRITNLIPADQHQIYRVDGKYEHGTGSNVNPMMPGINTAQQPHFGMIPGQPQPMMQQQYRVPAGPMQQQCGGMPNYLHMQTAMQFGGGMVTTPPQVSHGQDVFDWVKSQPMSSLTNMRGYEPSAINGVAAEALRNEVPAFHNRSLDESDLGPRNEDTPIRGQVMYIEVVPVRVTEDEASIVTDGSQNAYGVYRREAQGDITPAVHIGDFLTPAEAVEYGKKLSRLFGVPAEDYVSPAPADAAE